MKKGIIFILVLMFTINWAFAYDPPVGVTVDDAVGTVSWFAPVTALINDNIDSYTSGDYIAVVGDDWVTWSNAPGGAEDALVTDVMSNSPSNSVLVELNNDLILIMEDYTEGIYQYEMKMYVPAGYCGYFNLQKTSTPGDEWAFQVYFQTNGMASVDAGGPAAATYGFNHDEWINLKMIVDLDNDWATFYHNDVEIIGYQWTLGTFGDLGLLQFGGVNIYGGANETQPTDIPMFYFDDVVFSELQDVTGYNVYLNSILETLVGNDVTEYTYSNLVAGDTYTAGVSAVYTDGESDIVEVDFTYNPITNFDAPSNLLATVIDYNDVELTWEAPSGAAEWMRWDSAENGDGIGLSQGGTFYSASHWNPSDLTEFDGAEISIIEFFPNTEADYVIKIWTGANAGTLVTSEVVTSPTVGSFQEVILSTPVTIDASMELWFGYEVTHAVGDYPAGTDFGPAVVGFGDMISMDGSEWEPMSGLGLDYNWNLAAYIAGSDGEAIVLSKPHKAVKAVSNSLLTERSPFSSMPISHSRESRSLSSYKIYRDGSEIVEISDPATLTYTDESLDAGSYEYTIMAYYTNPDGESALTGPVDATVVLDCPTNFDAQFQNSNVIITWGAPARGIDSYNVYRDGVLLDGVTGLMLIDINPAPGTYMYSVTTIFDGDWESDPCDEVEVIVPGTSGDDVLMLTRTELTGNYPNPFNPITTISFSLKEAGHVSIDIYNMRGQLVKTLINAELDSNFHNIVWDGKDNSGKNISSGVYFYKMKAQNYNSTKKMILMK